MSPRPVARSKIDLAKAALINNPTMTGTQFAKDHKISMATATRAVTLAREELTKHDQELINGELALRKNDATIATKAANVRIRQQQEALRVLESQITRIESLPEILVALRAKTFKIKDGVIVGIHQMVKAYSKDGSKILLTPASIVNEYLEAEKRILEQERLVTGITAAERAATASAGKTDITLQIPISPEQAREIKPVDG